MTTTPPPTDQRPTIQWVWTKDRRWTQAGDPATARIVSRPIDAAEFDLEHDCITGRIRHRVSVTGHKTDVPEHEPIDTPHVVLGTYITLVTCPRCPLATDLTRLRQRTDPNVTPSIPLDVLRKVIDQHQPTYAPNGEALCRCGVPWPLGHNATPHLLEEALADAGFEPTNWKHAL